MVDDTHSDELDMANIGKPGNLVVATDTNRTTTFSLEGMTWKCKVRGKMVKSIVQHERSHINVASKCFICGKVVKDIELHMSRTHEGCPKPKQTCLVCLDDFVDLKTHHKKVHKVTATTPTDQICPTCSLRVRHVEYHMHTTHSRSLPHQRAPYH